MINLNLHADDNIKDAMFSDIYDFNNRNLCNDSSHEIRTPLNAIVKFLQLLRNII